MGRGIGGDTFRAYAVRLTIMVLVTSALLTTFSVLDEQYRMGQYSDAAQVKDPVPLPDSWYLVPARFMTYISILLPIVATIGASLSYFRQTDGSRKRRYLKAMGLSCLIFPWMCLLYLPWTVYQVAQNPDYLGYDDFMFVRALLPVYCVLVVVISLGVNGFAWFRESRTRARSNGTEAPR